MNNYHTIDASLRTICEVYSRPVGYLRPVQQWNKGKRSEFVVRCPYNKQLNEKYVEKIAKNKSV